MAPNRMDSWSSPDVREPSHLKPPEDYCSSSGSSGSGDTCRLRVAVLGPPGAGKSALIAAAFDDKEEEGEIACLNVNGEMIEVVFEEIQDLADERSLACADAFLVVFSVADGPSLGEAAALLALLRYLEKRRAMYGPYRGPGPYTRTAVLVANKVDLVRSRQVTTHEARALAAKHEAKFAEVSALFGHNVRPLLVRLVRQIRAPDKPRGLVARFLDRCADFKTRSCENLHVL